MGVSHETITALLARARAAYAAGDRQEVRACCTRLLGVTANADAEHYLGLMDYFDGDALSGERHMRAALALQGGNPLFHNNLGLCLRAQGRPEEAIAAFRAALRLERGYLPAWGNLALELSKRGEHDEALAAFEQVLAAQPNSPQAHYGRAQILLAQGDYARAWAEHEWRLACPEFAGKYALPPIFRAMARWQGEDLAGKRLLLVSEQGIGDTVQFMRYAAKLAGRADKVALFLRDPKIRNLVAGVAGLDEIHLDAQAIPKYDYYAYLMSLPLLLGTDSLDAVPAGCPYLFPADARRSAWRRRLAAFSDGRLKVGLAWAGNRAYAHDPARSCPFDALTTLFDLPVAWVNLQLDASLVGPHTAPDRFVDWSREFADFAETAALIAELDLVICVDTSIAHVAGALGRPVWIMLGKPAEWRWLDGREDSPWYPSARLFRQDPAGDWYGVVARLRQALAELSSDTGRVA